jgi:hypothetical protein
MMRDRQSRTASVMAAVLALSLLASTAVDPRASVLGDTGDLTITKTANASGTQAPGDTFAYTIQVTASAALSSLIVADGAFDYPQVSVTSSSFSVNGGGAQSCGTRPDNIWCRVGSVGAGTTVVATINVKVNSNVDVACDKPGAHGTLDSKLQNIAKARWQQAGIGYVEESARVTVNLDCTGYDPNAAPPPVVTILSGPSGSTTTPSATFTFSGTQNPTSFRCALDGGAFSTCSSPKSYSGLSVGTHFIDVQGVNATGAGVPARRTWSVANPFSDVGSSIFREDILWLWSAGITGGCSSTRFCPTARVTREQMASFLVRALDLPATGTDYFDDDSSSIHEANINRLAAAGITGGCGVDRFCPGAYVTRGEMASFLSRAFALPSTSTDYFTDDGSSIHESNINRLAKSGITGGCDAGRFCPAAHVTRGQMAAFLHRALTN